MATDHSEWSPELRPVSAAKATVNSRRRRTGPQQTLGPGPASTEAPGASSITPWLPLAGAVGSVQESILALAKQVEALDGRILSLTTTVQRLADQQAAILVRLESEPTQPDAAPSKGPLRRRPSPSPSAAAAAATTEAASPRARPRLTSRMGDMGGTPGREAMPADVGPADDI